MSGPGSRQSGAIGASVSDCAITKRLSAANPFLPFIMVFPVCSVHTGWDVIARASWVRVLCYQYGGASRVVSMRRIAAKLAMCTALEELSEVKLLRGEGGERHRITPSPLSV